MSYQNITPSEAEALQHIEEVYNDHKIVTLELHPWTYRSIQPSGNQIRVFGDFKLMHTVNNVSVAFYDWAVEKYHNKRKP